jgi:hypothetical protein
VELAREVSGDVMQTVSGTEAIQRLTILTPLNKMKILRVKGVNVVR